MSRFHRLVFKRACAALIIYPGAGHADNGTRNETQLSAFPDLQSFPKRRTKCQWIAEILPPHKMPSNLKSEEMVSSSSLCFTSQVRYLGVA